MAKITVGIPSLDKPTPMFMKYILRAVSFISGVWALLPQDMIGLTDIQLSGVNKWLLVSNTILLFAIKFFGWNGDKPDTDNP